MSAISLIRLATNAVAVQNEGVAVIFGIWYFERESHPNELTDEHVENHEDLAAICFGYNSMAVTNGSANNDCKVPCIDDSEGISSVV